jgi:hypothetical protein
MAAARMIKTHYLYRETQMVMLSGSADLKTFGSRTCYAPIPTLLSPMGTKNGWTVLRLSGITGGMRLRCLPLVNLAETEPGFARMPAQAARTV